MKSRNQFLGAAVAAALLAAGNPGHAQDKGVEVKLSGQINRAILNADDGTDNKWFNTDNGNSTTRFRFNAEGDAGRGLRAGILFEVEYPSNSSGAVSMGTREVSPTLNERHMDAFVRGGFGTVRLGQGDGAANGASEVDLSGTTVAHYSSSPDVGGAFTYRSGSAFTGAKISDSISNQDFESRYDRVLYQSPNFNGFMAETSWGNKDTNIGELALRYSGKLDGLGTLAGAIGYSNENGVAGAKDDRTVGGSVSWLHGSGLNLTFTHTTRDLPGRDGKFDYLKLGYKTGDHAVSVDYGIGKDQAMSGDDAKVYGIGYVFTPVAWWEVFALLKQHSLDRPGTNYDDVRFFMVGSRIKF